MLRNLRATKKIGAGLVKPKAVAGQRKSKVKASKFLN